MGGVLAAAGCSRRAPAKDLTDYAFTKFSITVWSNSQPEDYKKKGMPKPGDRLPKADLEEHIKNGLPLEKMLENGFVQPAGVTDKAELPQSGWVFTASLVEGMKMNEPKAYAEWGSPKAGEPATNAEVGLMAMYINKMEQREALVTRGMFAPPDAPWVNSVYKVKGDLEEWLALSKEEPMEPLYPIVDPHHHLWTRDRPAGSHMETLEVHSFGTRQAGHNYPHEQLVSDAKGNAVVGTVFVECNTQYQGGWPMPDQERSAAESKWVQKIADQSPVPMAIIAHLDLFHGRESMERGIMAHRGVAANLVGVRHSLAWHEGAPVYSRSLDGQIKEVSKHQGFRDSMEVLADHGLSFDTWLFHTNLPELIDLAKACPRTQIVCDHCGGPLGVSLAGFSLEEATKEWRVHITELAKCENVVVKLSGLSMPVSGFAFDRCEKPPSSEEMAIAYKPYFAHCLECFGPKRCIFATNFPVDKVSGSYTTHWNAFKLIAKELLPDDEDAQRALFYDNAVRVYRLDKKPFNMPSASRDAEGLPKY